jgi:tetratricopeptide (TPR) repeat protein
MTKSLKSLHLLLAFYGLSTLLLAAATPEGASDRLRKLLKMPLISLEAGISLNSEEGFAILQNKADASKEIAELRKQLKADSSDAERYDRLGDLYQRGGDSRRASDYYKKAATLYRQQVNSRPDDPELLVNLGKALWATDQNTEAESVLRRAVRIDPSRPTSWQTLGHFLQAEAKRALVSENANRSALSPERLLYEIASNKPQAEQVTRARKVSTEASACFDRAVAVATNCADAYLQRGLHKSFDGYLQNVFAFVQGEKTDMNEVMKGMFTVESLPDLQTAARLSSSEYRTVAMAAFFEAFAADFEFTKHAQNTVRWQQLPDRSQRSIREAVARLDNFGQNPDAKISAGAMECLTIIQAFVIGDRAGAEKSARRAVTLDPSRDTAWDLLIGFLVKPESYQELRTVCEQRLRHRESSRNRILLAKAYEKLNQLDRAEQHVQAALRLDSDDFTANLSEAVLLMKRPSDSGLASAYRYLTRSEQLLKKATQLEQRHLQFILTSSIYYALRGETDKARQLLRDVLEADRNNEDAREILSALSWSPQ